MKKPDKPTRKFATLSHCSSCLARYVDGKVDCENVKCEFYSWMPYAKLEPDLWWLEYNPARPGLIKWENCESNMTEEKRKEAAMRMHKGRNSKK